MRTRTLVIGAAVALAASTVVTASAGWADESDPALGKAIDAIIDSADGLTAGQIGVVVADAESGDVLYDHNGQMRALPASNTKLLTSTAAMDILGPDYTFRTDLASEATVDSGTLAGDLYLRGTGDPTMLAEDYAGLAKQLADAGVTTIDGDLVADDTAYDASRYGPDWEWDDLPYYYAAEVSALTVAPDTDYDAGNVIVNVAPGESEGDDASVTMTPDNDYVPVESDVTTSAAGGEPDLTFDRELAADTITVTGSIPADADPASEWVTVHNPTGYAADVFGEALRDNGISVAGDVRLSEAAPDGAESLASHDSMPLSELLTPFLKLSNNGHAETLVKAIGRETADEGTWDAGLAAIESYVADQGMDVDEQRQADGSGMSRWNDIPPRDFAKLLVSVRDADWFDTWFEAQPIACVPDRMVGGTLRSRMCDTPAEGNVHAKTGSLTGVSSLSGYVTDADGRDLVFSVISNDFLVDSVKDVEDAIAITLASYHDGDEQAVTSDDVPEPERHGPANLECSWVKPIAC